MQGAFDCIFFDIFTSFSSKFFDLFDCISDYKQNIFKSKYCQNYDFLPKQFFKFEIEKKEAEKDFLILSFINFYKRLVGEITFFTSTALYFILHACNAVFLFIKFSPETVFTHSHLHIYTYLHIA